eukprot:2358836-Rhodomonas_salina.5
MSAMLASKPARFAELRRKVTLSHSSGSVRCPVIEIGCTLSKVKPLVVAQDVGTGHRIARVGRWRSSPCFGGSSECLRPTPCQYRASHSKLVGR